MNMTRAWLYVIIASCFEVGWVIGMKHSTAWYEWGATFIAILLSFYLMIQANKSIPVGTVYAVFVGLGTAGTTVAEILLFDAPVQISKLVLLALLLAGVLILKLEQNPSSKQQQAMKEGQ